MALRTMVALDGSRLDLETGHAVQEAFSGTGVLAGERELNGNVAPLVESLAALAEASPTLTVDDVVEQERQGGRAIAASVRQRAVRGGFEMWVHKVHSFWVGETFCLEWFDVETTLDASLSLLDRIRVAEGVDGITVSGATAPLRWAKRPMLMTELVGTGSLDVMPLTRREEAGLPGHEGTQVDGGQLYVRVVDTEAGPLRYFTLVTETAVVHSLPRSADLEQATVDALSSLRATWTPAA